MALGGEKSTVYTFIFHVKTFSREKVKYKKKGQKNMQVENARGYKGDKTITKTVVEKDKNGNTVEYQYNSEGICLVATVLKWA